MLGQDTEPTEASLLSEYFAESAGAFSDAAALSLARYIEDQKQKVIAETKRAIVPTVIGIGAAAGAVAGLVVLLIARRL